MYARFAAPTMSLAAVLFLASCADGPLGVRPAAPSLTATTAATADGVVAAIRTTPVAATLAAGSGFAVTGTPMDAEGRALAGPTVSWTTSDAGVASVSSTGELSGVAPGTVTLVAASESRRDSVRLTVTTAAGDPLTVAPSSATMAVSTSLQLRVRTVEKVRAGGRRKPTWASASPDVATVSSSTGLVTAVAPGTTLVTVRVGTESASTLVEVFAPIAPPAAPAPTPRPAPPAVASLTVSPGSVAFVQGQTQQLTATARAADGAELGGLAIRWTTSDPARVTVSATGLVTGVAAGTATITASTDTVSRSVRVDVSGTTSGTPSGTAIFPGDNIQSAVNAHPAGTQFVIKAGVHRLQQVMPKAGNAFVGEPGAVMSGARLLTEFTREGSHWVASGQTQQGAPHGECFADRPRCSYPEDLFLDDKALTHVASLAQVVPGTWFFDYGADKIYFSDDPTGRKVEASAVPRAFGGNYGVNDVTIRGLIVEKYANPAQKGAVEVGGGTAWRIEANEIRWNHGIGIRASTRTNVVDNRIHHNGQLGMSASGENVVVERNEIAYNNTLRFNWYWEAGGTKFVYTTDLVVRANHSHHNQGPGLWTDINNVRTLYEGNRVEDNASSGIFHEISYAATIRNNTVARNGWAALYRAGWLDGAGILVNNSSDVEVYGNTLTGNAHGIGAIQDARTSGGTHGAWIVQNLYVHDNAIVQTSGTNGAVQNAGDQAVYTQRNNRFERNTYTLGTNALPFTWMDASRSDAAWRAYGQDVTGSFNR